MQPEAESHEPGLKEPLRLPRDREDDALDVLTSAFLDDPVIRFVAGGGNRSHVTRYVLGTLLQHGLRHGQVWAYMDDAPKVPEGAKIPPQPIRGVAIWFPPGTDKLTLFRRLVTGMLTERLELGRQGSRRMSVFNRASGELRRGVISGAHWHLQIIGVDPDYQRRGLGASMVRYLLRRIDREALPTYLNTTTDEGVALYQRLGFAVGAEADVPGDGPHLWAMVRPAATPGSAPLG